MQHPEHGVDGQLVEVGDRAADVRVLGVQPAGPQVHADVRHEVEQAEHVADGAHDRRVGHGPAQLHRQEVAELEQRVGEGLLRVRVAAPGWGREAGGHGRDRVLVGEQLLQRHDARLRAR